MILVIILSIAWLLFILMAWHHFERALLLLIALLPTYVWRLSFGGIPTTFFEVCLIALVIVGLLRGYGRSWFVTWKGLSRHVQIYAVLFLVSAVISTRVAEYSLHSLGILKAWIVEPLLLGLIVKSTFYPDRLSKVIGWLIGSGVIVSLLAWFQIGDMDRVRSVYDVPNSLALFLAPLVAMSLWLAWQKRLLRWWFSSAVMAVSLVLTQSVAGLVAVVISLLFGWAMLHRKEKLSFKKIAGFVAICIVLLVISWPKLVYLARPFLQSGQSSSLQVRIQLWDIGWQLVQQSPFLGIGLGEFEPHYQVVLHDRFVQYERNENLPKPLSEFVFRDPHNFLLSFWLNLGLLGLISLLGLVFSKVCRALRAKEITVYEQAALLALIVMLLHGLVDTVYWKNDLSVLLWLLVI